MVTRFPTDLLKLISTTAIVFVLCGCKTTPGHDENVNAANARWKAVRSASMLRMAQQQFDAGDLDQAEKTLAAAIGIDASNPYLHVMAGRVALEHGHLERSFKRFAVGIELDQHLTSAHYYQGIVLQRWTRHERALESYQKAYELQPDNTAYLLAVGETLVALNRVDDALQLMTDKMEYFDQSAALRVAVGHMYEMRGEHDQAVRYLSEAVLLQPDDIQVQEDLALAQLACGQTVEAVRTLEQLCARAELIERHDLTMRLGGAYMKVGRTDDARSLLIQLTRNDPNNTYAWLKLSEIAMDLERYPEALTAARRARRLEPQRSEGYLVEGMIWEKRGINSKAMPMFERAAELAPESAAPLLMRGIILQRAGKKEEAAEAYAEALRREPQHEGAQRLLAKVSG